MILRFFVAVLLILLVSQVCIFGFVQDFVRAVQLIAAISLLIVLVSSVVALVSSACMYLGEIRWRFSIGFFVFWLPLFGAAACFVALAFMDPYIERQQTAELLDESGFFVDFSQAENASLPVALSARIGPNSTTVPTRLDCTLEQLLGFPYDKLDSSLLTSVGITIRENDTRFTPEILDWLNHIPRSAQLTFSLAHPNPAQLRSISEVSLPITLAMGTNGEDLGDGCLTGHIDHLIVFGEFFSHSCAQFLERKAEIWRVDFAPTAYADGALTRMLSRIKTKKLRITGLNPTAQSIRAIAECGAASVEIQTNGQDAGALRDESEESQVFYLYFPSQDEDFDTILEIAIALKPEWLQSELKLNESEKALILDSLPGLQRLQGTLIER
ncbi:MAG TPA: hypothetical protein DDW52_27015 [Planctomycetaceae bacterium]|nr:hypothetical protein [Planctomycetaceae bacterium]